MVSVYSLARSLSVLLAVTAMRGVASSQSPTVIGAARPHEWALDAVATRAPMEETLTARGSPFLTVHFAEFNLADGDAVALVDPATGDVLVEYTGRGRGDMGTQGGFYSPRIWSDSVTVQFKPSSSSAPTTGAYGFTIDKLTRSTAVIATRSLCSEDDTLPAVCYSATSNTTEPEVESVPNAYEKARAVARLTINGAESCTGWLVGSEGHLLTNAHCINSQADAASTDFELMAESGACEDQCVKTGSCRGTVVATTSTLIAFNTELDYALVQLNATEDLSPYGYFKLRVAGGEDNEQIYIPQHPQGKAKRLAVVVDSGDVARITMDQSTACGEHRVTYDADTQGGSSGSPLVAAKDNAVIGLHSCGTTGDECQNSGLDIRGLIHELKLKNIVPKDALDDDNAEVPTGGWIPATPVASGTGSAASAGVAPTPAPTVDFCGIFFSESACKNVGGARCMWRDDGKCHTANSDGSAAAGSAATSEAPAASSEAPAVPVASTPASEASRSAVATAKPASFLDTVCGWSKKWSCVGICHWDDSASSCVRKA